MKIFYRIIQFIMSLAIRILTKRKYNLINRNESLYEIVSMLKKSNKTNVLVVTTPGFIKRKTLDNFFEKLNLSGIKVTIFSDVTPDPTIECIEKTVFIYKESNCNAIVAIGGGSVIDCAKIVAARVVKPKMSIRQMKGTLKIRKKIPDLYAVPTTAGTGSEATAAAVVTDTVNSIHYKYPISDFCLIPKYAILDANLTISLPEQITATTGMDALTHAVEAYTNLFISNYAKINAKNAVKLIYENLLIAYNDSQNINARQNMLEASFYAGIAFTNNFVGYVHAVAHALGGLYGIPHGKANAIVLPYVIEQFEKSSQKKLSELADVVGINGNSAEEKAKLFIESIRKLNQNMNLPEKILELREEDFDIIIERAIKESNPTYPVPSIWNKKDFELLLKKLLP